MSSEGTYLEFTYDQLGRPIAAFKDGTGGRLNLYSFSYDLRPTWIPSCGLSKPTNYLGGRVASRIEAGRRVAFSYHPGGSLEREIYFTAFGLGCETDVVRTYNSAGRPTTIQYPYGRTVSYGYASGEHLPSTVSITSYRAGAWQATQIIKDVVWGPDGDVRRYKMLTGNSIFNSEWNTVEYSKLLPSNGSTCASLAMTTTWDPKFQNRGLWVSTGDWGLGQGNGNILKQTWDWTGDQLTTQRTCFTLLGQSNPHVQVLSYDNKMRLTGAVNSNFPARATGSGSGVAAKVYGYNLRDSRLTQTVDSCPYNLSLGSGQSSDLLNVFVPNSANASCLGAYSGYTRLYDLDGRTTTTATAKISTICNNDDNKTTTTTNTTTTTTTTTTTITFTYTVLEQSA
jgi:hypothetical protein